MQEASRLQGELAAGARPLDPKGWRVTAWLLAALPFFIAGIGLVGPDRRWRVVASLVVVAGAALLSMWLVVEGQSASSREAGARALDEARSTEKEVAATSEQAELETRVEAYRRAFDTQTRLGASGFGSPSSFITAEAPSVVALRYIPASDAHEMIKERLGKAAGNAVSMVNIRTNTLHLVTTHPEVERVRELVAVLDQPQPADLRASVSGVGLVLRERDGHIHVESVQPGTPAAIDGRIQKGDRLLCVATPHHPLVMLDKVSLREVLTLVRGKEGSSVTLGLIPQGKPENEAYEVTLVRRRLPEGGNAPQKLNPLLAATPATPSPTEITTIVNLRFVTAEDAAKVLELRQAQGGLGKIRWERLDRLSRITIVGEPRAVNEAVDFLGVFDVAPPGHDPNESPAKRPDSPRSPPLPGTEQTPQPNNQPTSRR
jgi:hypothetical protein